MEAAQIPKGQFMEGSVSSMSKLLPICQCVIYQRVIKPLTHFSETSEVSLLPSLQGAHSFLLDSFCPHQHPVLISFY